jgi:DNA-binding NtrC family response regulator
MRALADDMACAVRGDSSVMISGERGAGKKFVAQTIHQRSRRRSAPFVVAHWPNPTEPCAASTGLDTIPPFEEGVWKPTGNGTLFIDEIQRITPMLQLELLRFTESGTTARRDVRLMTAASPDVFACVQVNQFRSDLFYRLNVMHLKVPALRDRAEDIPILFDHYLGVYATARPRRLSTAALQRLIDYPWPGNVAELKSVAEGLARQDVRRHIEPNDLPLELRSNPPPRASGHRFA